MRDDFLESLGHDIVEIPFIWIPDGYFGLRPGYPWFEAGRITLSAEQVAARQVPKPGSDGAQRADYAEAEPPSYGREAQQGHFPGSDWAGEAASKPGASGADASSQAHRYSVWTDEAINSAVEALCGLRAPDSGPETLDDALAGALPIARTLAASRPSSTVLSDYRANAAPTSNGLEQPRTPTGRGGTSNPVNSRTLTGIASYYDLPGNRMANGQIFNPDAMNAAMLGVGLGTTVTVALADDPRRSIDVVVTDRGPYVAGRIIDLTPAAFTALTGGLAAGVVRVVVTIS